MPTPQRLLRRTLLWGGLLVVAYLAALAYVALDWERFVFAARPLSTNEAQQIAASFPQARSVVGTAADGTRLHAWYLPAAAAVASRRLLLYFGGESEQVHWLLARRPALAGWDLLLVDYRGYGLSDGQPSAASIADDAALWLRIARDGNETIGRADRLVLMGTGLGSVVATHLAATRTVEGLVLVAPYDGVAAIARARLPIFPLRWIVGARFATSADAPKVRAPSLFCVAAHDARVGTERSRELYARWGSASRSWVELANASREGAATDPLCWTRIGEFLRGL